MKELLSVLFSSPENISALIRHYKPIMYTICDEIFDIYKDFVNNKEAFDTVAKCKWNKYSSMIDQGFTEEQAMAIMLAEINDAKDYVREISGVCEQI